MKKSMVLFLLILVFAATTILASEKVSKNAQVDDPVKIEISTGGFNEESLSSLYDSSGAVVINFSQFNNPNSRFGSYKVYDDNKNHIYTIVTDEKNQSILIFDKDGNRAKITGKLSLGLFGPSMKAELDFYGKPYNLGTFLDRNPLGFNTDITYVIGFESKAIIKESYSLNNAYTIKNKEIIAGKSFIQTQKYESGVILLALVAFDSMMNERIVDILKECKLRANMNQSNMTK